MGRQKPLSSLKKREFRGGSSLSRRWKNRGAYLGQKSVAPQRKPLSPCLRRIPWRQAVEKILCKCFRKWSQEKPFLGSGTGREGNLAKRAVTKASPTGTKGVSGHHRSCPYGEGAGELEGLYSQHSVRVIGIPQYCGRSAWGEVGSSWGVWLPAYSLRKWCHAGPWEWTYSRSSAQENVPGLGGDKAGDWHETLGQATVCGAQSWQLPGQEGWNRAQACTAGGAAASLRV